MPKLLSLEILQSEHQKVLILQNDCVSDFGFVYTEKRNEYNVLCKKERQIRDAIKYLEELNYIKV